MIVSRRDIVYNVGVCARYPADPNESHKKAIKRVSRYVNCIADHGFFYNKNTTTHFVGTLILTGQETVIIESRYFYIGNNLMSWYKRKA